MRLDSRDYRFLLISLALLGATVWFSATYYHRAFPEASIDFRVTREQAGDIARGFLATLGHQPEAYREASRFGFDDEAKTFLERELGLERANQVMGSHVRLWRWSYRWFRPLQKEEYRVDVTPRGEPVGFQHLLDEAAPRPALEPPQARALAEQFLARRMSRPADALEFVEGSSLKRPARTDHVFTWKERGFDLRDATYRFEVTVLGNEIGGYREYLKVPETWLRSYERLRSKNNAAQSVDTVIMLVLVVGLLATVIARLRSRDVRWRRAATVGLIGGGLLLLSSLNSHRLSEFGYPTTDSHASFLVRQLVQYVLSALAATGLLFVLTAGSEPLYREGFGRFVSLGNLFTLRGIRTKSFFKGSVLGMALTGIFVAYQIGFYLLAYRFGAWSPADVPYDDLLNTSFPWLFVLLGGFFPAVSEEFLFRIFAITWLRKVTRSMWAALLLAGFIWGFGHAGYPQQPFYIRGLEVGIGGVALGLIMLRWGILPALVWHYSVDALYTALLLLRSHNPYFVFSGAVSAGVIVLPALVAGIAYLRTGRFLPETDLTNASEGTAQPPAAVEAEQPAETSAYQPWSPRRRTAALALLAAGLLALLAPVEKFGNRPRFAIGETHARASADAFLARQGIDPRSFRTVAYAFNRWADGGEAWRPRLAGKYFLERRPVAWVEEAFARTIPLQVRVVRYYRPLDKEEVRVSIHPETGAVTAFSHVLPEDRPGASLEPEPARQLAASFLAGRGLRLEDLELKETSAENRKARRDHMLVWEARPGDPRNLDEARYRVRVEVAGDRISSWGSFWKLPEAYTRERERSNALSVTLSVLRIAVIALAVVASILLLVRFTRRHVLRWGMAARAAVPLVALGVLASVLELPAAMRLYDTAIPLETFRMTLGVGLLMAAIGMFIGFACACGQLSVLRPRSPRSRPAALDALLAAGAALGLMLFVSQIGWLLRDRFHAHALLGARGADVLDSWFPSISCFTQTVQQTVFLLAGAALAAYLAARVRSRLLLAGVVVLLVAGAATGGVHTAGEFVLAMTLGLLGAAAALVFAVCFARSNELAWLAGAGVLALVPHAVYLLSQPAYSMHGWLLLALGAAALAVPLLNARHG